MVTLELLLHLDLIGENVVVVVAALTFKGEVM